MKKIWIVTELFYPDETSTAYIMTEIAEHLTQKFDVHVICSSNSERDDLIHTSRTPLNSKVKIIRVSEPTLDKNKLSTRIFRFIILTWKLSRRLWNCCNTGEPILIVTNPASILLTVSFIKKRKKSPLYILVHDVFPENTIPAHIISSNKSLLYKIMKICFDSSYRSADKLIALGRDMAEILKTKLGKNKNKTKIEIIQNWAQTDIIKPKIRREKHTIEILYAGNIGRVQGLQNFFVMINKVSNPVLRFSFWGDGAIKEQLVKYTQDNEITNVVFHGKYRRDDQNNILNTCDLALVILADGMYGLGVPSKTYNIMAAGKPILFIGNLKSEIALTIKEYNIGYCYEPTNFNGIISFLSSIDENSMTELLSKGKRARKLAETIYSKDNILDKFLNVIN